MATPRAKQTRKPTVRLFGSLVSIGLAAASLVAMSGTSGGGVATTTAAKAGGQVTATPDVYLGPYVGRTLSQSPSAFCLATYGFACYGPSDLQSQYDFTSLYAKGITGAGQTIVIFDAFGSPTIQQDLTAFDQAFGLPDPPAFNIYMPEGNSTVNFTRVPSSKPLDHDKRLLAEVGWANETTLDVEWAHALAPGANIDLVLTPIAETAGVQGIPNFQNAQAFALSNQLGTIWSDSWGSSEQGFGSAAPILNLDRLYARAAANGVTAFFATGDSGTANPDKQGHFFYPTVTYPTSSPNVVAVGGTAITTPVGEITSYQPESAWYAGGGGYSSVFSEPSYQAAAGISDPSGMRGLPDVSMNASETSYVVIYESFLPENAGFNVVAGTSEATPLWAATDALMNQADGPLGFLAPRLYQIYEKPTLYAEAFHDITVGNNSFGGVPGYSAAPGWDPVTGLGTPDAAGLAEALNHTTP